MAINKLALIRYKIIDNCLRQTHRKWTLEDLIEKVSEGIYEFEGIHSGISKRTIQGDIQLMRSNKLGYNAPIVVQKRKYYTYEDQNYSISNSPLSDSDMSKMKDAVDVLKHLNGFSYFEEMSDMIVRLENNLSKQSDSSVSYIQMESNKLLKGLNYLTPIHQAIREKTPLFITYKSFKSKTVQEGVYYPYLLKEYRNRWFVICKPKKGKILLTLALDRIEDLEKMDKSGYVEYEGVDFERYYADAIGVTKSIKDRGFAVILQVDARNAPYVLTKPLHPSQSVQHLHEDGSVVIRIDVVLNFELEREILGFGESVRVLGPRVLKERIRKRIEKNLEQYQSR